MRETSNYPRGTVLTVPPVVVLVWSQVECGLRGGGLALLSLELRAEELAGFTLGVPGRSDAKNNGQKSEKQHLGARGMLQERN